MLLKSQEDTPVIGSYIPSEAAIITFFSHEKSYFNCMCRETHCTFNQLSHQDAHPVVETAAFTN